MTGNHEEQGSPPSPADFLPTQSMELAWLGQRGDAAAVNELFTRYVPRLRRILRIKIAPGLRSAVDPDDVLQETLIVANRRLAELEVRSPASILQWLSKIADYEIKNRLEYVRALKRDPTRERRSAAGPDERPDPDPPARDPSPSQELVREEMEEIVDHEVRQLEPAEYREVILQRDYYEGDWERIREALGRPTVAAAQDLYHRAQKRLRERLARFLR